MKYLVPSQRIDIIYESLIHGATAVSIAQRYSLNYTTVINAINGYLENGRIFKLLPVHSKLFILNQREKGKISQKLYREYRKRLALRTSTRKRNRANARISRGIVQVEVAETD